MRRPKGIKTKKSVRKRFKITARGKVLRMRAGKRHLLAAKSPKRRRNLGTAVTVGPEDAHRVLESMPFNR
jgi:large subunit ribosomal protein L35